MRLTLVISSLGRGGAERTMSYLASCWAAQGVQVTLLTVDRGDSPAYSIHPAINLQEFGMPWPSANIAQGAFRNLRRIRVLRRSIRESLPDLVISFMDRTNVLVLLATLNLGVPVIVCERTDPSGYSIGWFWNCLRRTTYHFADALVCQTGAVLDWFQARMRINGYVIPNMAILPPAMADLDSNSRHSRVAGSHTATAMGRLVPEKGFDLLLDAFSSVAEKHLDWSLVIMGNGPLASSLQMQIELLGLKGRVKLVGEIQDPFPIFCSADLFVLSSRVEGFPNALCEAMACGLPAISFRCSAGPSEIIRDGVDGILVPPQDVAKLAAALDRLMGDSELRLQFAARAPEVLIRYSKDRVLNLWNQLFKDLLSKEGTKRSQAAGKQGIKQVRD